MRKIKKIYKEDGLFVLFLRIFLFFLNIVKDFFKIRYLIFISKKTFKFNGRVINYFFHNYNSSYDNERKVEVAIIKDFLKTLPKEARVLEVGNVLKNYGISVTDILDKYDESSGVIRCDVVNFVPEKKYDAIVSISTLEHVGWDESVKEPKKISLAVINLKENCLNNDGVMMVTLPIGYNSYFDKFLEKKTDLFSKSFFFKRISSDNQWIQVDYEDVVDCKFGQPFNNANALFIGVTENK